MTLPIQDTLDSSIRDVMGLLQKSDKADVLLCAVERLPMNGKYVSQSVAYWRRCLNIPMSQGPERPLRLGLSLFSVSHPWFRTAIRAYELIFSVPSLELQLGQVMRHFKVWYSIDSL
jgi:hypothetical protein